MLTNGLHSTIQNFDQQKVLVPSAHKTTLYSVERGVEPQINKYWLNQVDIWTDYLLDRVDKLAWLRLVMWITHFG